MRVVLLQITVTDAVTDEEVMAQELTFDPVDVRIMTEPSVVVTGDPFSGFTVIGPFASPDDATESEDALKAEDWWVTALDEPEQDFAPDLGSATATKHEPEF